MYSKTEDSSLWCSEWRTQVLPAKQLPAKDPKNKNIKVKKYYDMYSSLEHQVIVVISRGVGPCDIWRICHKNLSDTSCENRSYTDESYTEDWYRSTLCENPEEWPYNQGTENWCNAKTWNELLEFEELRVIPFRGESIYDYFKF